MSPSLASLGFPIEFGGVVHAAREAGMDVASLCEFRAEEAWKERSQIWGRVMREVQLDGLPIRVAQRFSLGEMGPLGMVAQVAPDLRSAFERKIRHQHVLTGAVVAQMRDDVARGTTILEHLPLGEADLGWRCRREMMIAGAFKFARDLSGGRVEALRVCFAHAAPPDPSEHEAFFGCEVRFDAGYDGLEFDRDALAIPLPGADAELSQFLIDHLSAIAGDQPTAAPPLVGKLRQAICRRIGDRTLPMDSLAHELGMSKRTLHRHLLEHETSYREILDRVRRELADELLGDSSHKLSEVAFLLGFSDASTFHRAYVRWTGRTPASRRWAPHGADA